MIWKVKHRLPPKARPTLPARPNLAHVKTAFGTKQEACEACEWYRGTPTPKCFAICGVCPGSMNRVTPWVNMPACPVKRWPQGG